MAVERDGIDVSIIMLTYNHENYIAQAIESVLAQEACLRYELLIGDDASTDRTPEIVRGYAERYPEVIRPVLRKQNMGATKNGVDLRSRARGRYLAALDGDDFWLDPRKLQEQFEFLEAHSEYSGCCGKCVVVNEYGIPDYTKVPSFVWNKRVFTLDDYLDRWKIPGQASTKMYRNIYQDMGNAERTVSERLHGAVGDKTSALLLLTRGPVYCTNKILSAYRYVNQRGKQNYFSQHYANPYRNHDMFLYSCRLEDWAREAYGIRAEMGKNQKKTRFCRFAEECVREPSLKRWAYLAEMLAHSHAPTKYAWYAVKTLIEME